VTCRKDAGKSRPFRDKVRRFLTVKHSPRTDSAPELLGHQPSPQLAVVLRSQSDAIIAKWADRLRQAIPSLNSLPFEELKDDLPRILARIADYLESTSPEDARALLERSPSQGITRFRQNYDVRALMLEDRLLRRVIIAQVEEGLARRLDQNEQLALDTAIDVMLQQAVAAFVDQQSRQLSAAAEAELKYLSFLSHDLRNNLSGVTMMLQVLREELSVSQQFAAHVKTIDDVQRSILNTIGGMGRLLESERLRRGGVQPQHQPVNLHQLASAVARPLSAEAEHKGLTLKIDIPAQTVIVSDAELITLVLQNLLGNAVKYSSKGVVRISHQPLQDAEDDGCVISVRDQGPGIDPAQAQHIFDAFTRGTGHVEHGAGLGLAIASQAAKLLGGTLTFASKPGQGSTFRLHLRETPEP
jgi:signal transduction histidine kinase